MSPVRVAYSVSFFVLAGVCEIGGGWLVWQWLREGKALTSGFIGAAVLILYGIIPTFQPAHFGRVYATYGAFLLSYLSCGVGSSMGTLQTSMTL